MIKKYLIQLMQHGGMEVIDCNNHVKSTIKYFGPSCAIHSLIDKYNPLGKFIIIKYIGIFFDVIIVIISYESITGDNSDHLCSLCIGKVPGEKCTYQDPYAGYEGAFRCLVEAGEIAFLVHTTIHEMTSTTFDFSTQLLPNELNL